MKFKIGDTVERCSHARGNMQVGDTGIITNYIGNVSFCVMYTINGDVSALHSGYNLKLVKPATINWKERLSK